MTVSYLPPRDHVLEGNREQIQRLVSTGIQRTDVEIKIFDAEDREVAFGEMGEIVTRSDVMMNGYWRNPDATAETLRWLYG